MGLVFPSQGGMKQVILVVLTTRNSVVKKPRYVHGDDSAKRRIQLQHSDLYYNNKQSGYYEYSRHEHYLYIHQLLAAGLTLTYTVTVSVDFAISKDLVDNQL
jgi:hypothetical protein